MQAPAAKKYPAVFALAGVVIGILLADKLALGAWVYLTISAVLLVGSTAAFFKERIYPAALLGLAGLTMLAAFNYMLNVKTFPPGHIIHYVDSDRDLMIYGTVDDWPVVKEQQTNLFVRVDSVGTGKETRESWGRLLINIGVPTTRLQYGDRIFFESRLYSIKGGRNPSGFDYRRYLNLRGVFGVAYLPNHYSLQVDPVGAANFSGMAARLREYIVGIFTQTLDSNSAALASGFLIGETKNVPVEIYELFRDSGTLHVLAVSGSNVAIVVLLFSFLLKASPFRQIGRTAILLVVIVLFSFLAYNQPSVVRAAIMAALILMGKLFQRRIEYNNIIALTALIILLFDPAQLFDIGFQLSFATAWGLIFILPRVSSPFAAIRRQGLYRFVMWPALVCLTAQIVSLPLSAYYFHRLPMISFLANVVVVPLVSLATVGEVILIITAAVLPILGQTIGAILNPIFQLTIFSLGAMASWSGSLAVDSEVPILLLLSYYILLVTAAMAISSKRARRFGLIMALMVLNGLLLTGVLAGRSEGRVTVFSIPGGIISIVESAHPHIVLCGLPMKEYSFSERIITPYLLNHGITTSDVIALSTEYQTLKETRYLMKSGVAAKTYIPAEAQNAYYDVCNETETAVDSSAVVFYSGTFPGTLSRLGSNLYSGILTYDLAKSTLVFSEDLNIIVQDFDPDHVKDRKTFIFVKPTFSDADLQQIISDSVDNTQLLICNKLTKSGAMLISKWRENREPKLPKILETSKVGAVELVNKEGRLQLVD